MNNCFYCGRPIKPGEKTKRRLVKTGEDRLQSVTAEGFRRVRTTFGSRVVCARCSKFLDDMERKREYASWATLAGILLLLIAVVALVATMQ